jgi:DnaK suppressor protein
MDEARARELLRRERERIERAIAEIEGSEPQAPDAIEVTHLDQHLADQGSDLYEKERDEGRLEDLREQLAAVERAEQRLAAGTYGLSIESGKPIPDARLEAMPTAERTVEEQAAWERRGGR